MSNPVEANQVPFIYNLFPPLGGEVANWMPHVSRAAKMGFNWLFLNPVQFPGESGSLYSVRDHDRLNPLFFPQADKEGQFAAFREFIKSTREAGLEVMLDLVINHTAHDSPLIKKKPDWFKWLDDGTIAHPGAMDNGHMVIWGDLAEVDNENSSDKAGLYNYWWEMIKEMLDLGVRGFRCDAAYKVPVDLWKLLIGRAKEEIPECCFFAETLGCPFEDNLMLTQAGFDFTFNSGKWWDYRGDWFLDQLREGCGRTRSICFPESHDTDRLMEEYRGDVARVKQHTVFTSLITSGNMIVMGFEYGFKKRCHVVKSKPEDWEGVGVDLTEFITHVNAVKAGNRIFQEDNIVERIQVDSENIMALQKTTIDKSESVLMIFNLYGQTNNCEVTKLRDLGFDTSKVILGALSISEHDLVLEPWGVAIIGK